MRQRIQKFHADFWNCDGQTKPADLNKATKSNLASATKFVLHQRELLATAKRCIDQAKRVATAAAAAHPELLDSLLKQFDDYSEKVIKDARSCPPFLTD